MDERLIGPPLDGHLALLPWNPLAPEVAARVAAAVRSRHPELIVEHVGSTAVPGLAGKGVVDLALQVSPEAIPQVTAELLALGFEPQRGPAPWPPTRPMLVGSIDLDGSVFAIQCHVVPTTSSALTELRVFRDALRADRALRADYEAQKEAAAGNATGSVRAYTIEKAAWIEDVLLRIGAWPTPSDERARSALEPGSTIGILGGGQLGRMIGFAARSLGYRIDVLDPDPACPAAAIADRVVTGAYDDREAALELARGCAVVTYELEHVSAEMVEALAEVVPVRPGLRALQVSQDRLAERRFLRDQGELTAEWRSVRGLQGPTGLAAAADALGYPFRVKEPIGGYDGRSQVRVAGPSELEAAIQALRPPSVAAAAVEPDRPLLAEQELEFDLELSVVVARDVHGRTKAFPAGRNVHDRGILVESVAPAPIEPALAAAASALAGRLARALDLVGLLTVELFLVGGRHLVVNELAPRVHNSGHWTIEGCRTSQFEQHVRAIAGLPLGSPELHTPVALVNVLGEGQERDARLVGVGDALADPLVHLSVYDKRRVFGRRKMGHIVATGVSADEALTRARRAAASLHWAAAGGIAGAGGMAGADATVGAEGPIADGTVAPATGASWGTTGESSGSAGGGAVGGTREGQSDGS